MTRPIPIFIACADEDKGVLEELLRQLSGLIREGRIECRHRYQIGAGVAWREQMKKDLWAADLILLLVSSFFVASEYHYGEEAALAIEQYRLGKALVIPVIIRAIEWKHLIFGSLKSLPEEKAVSMWSNREKAFVHIVKGIKETLDELQSKARSVVQGGEKPLLLWNIPYWRNPFFTNRHTILTEIKSTFSSPHTPLRIQALSGLGGVGKTQVAVEYAYRFAQNYQAVLWVSADSPEMLLASFVDLAETLHLPEKNETHQPLIVKAVKRWLQQNARWLLIVDNVEDLNLLQDVVPSPHSGHILVTTRSRHTGHTAQRIDLLPLTVDDGVLLLLHRANLFGSHHSLEDVSETEKTFARELVQNVDGLPLALDQAGAYIEETGRGLADYVGLYQTYFSSLLSRRGTAGRDHPASVTTTFTLSFEKVRALNTASAELLELCAFLYPEDIPEALLIEGASVLHPALCDVVTSPIELDRAIEDLLRFSLIQRDSGRHALVIHRLVQEVVKGVLSQEAQAVYAQQVIAVLSIAFPLADVSNWSCCQRYLPQAQAAAKLIQQRNIRLPEASQFLYRLGIYLSERGLYNEAEQILLQASTIEEHLVEMDDSRVLLLLNALANVYYKKGAYHLAEPILLRALALDKQTPGMNPTELAESLNTLARVYHKQGRFNESEPLLQRALTLRQQILDPQHPEIATSLNSLANFYNSQENYAQAEDLYRQALAIWQHHLGTQHPRVALSLNNLAVLSSRQEKYVQAEPLAIQALNIYEAILGPEHPDVTIALDTLTVIYQEQEKYTEAELLYQRMFAIYDRLLGADHPQLVVCYNNQARFYFLQGKFTEAESTLQRALSLGERVLGKQHHRVGTSLHTLANTYQAQGAYSEAENCYKRALAIRENALGPENRNTIRTREQYADLLQVMKQREKEQEQEH